MCGIFGIINYAQRATYHQMDQIRDMMVRLAKASEIRGSNATGIALKTREPRVFLLKDHKQASEFVQDERFHGLKNNDLNLRDNISFIMGHTRTQTKGTFRNNQNNHPIVYDLHAYKRNKRSKDKKFIGDGIHQFAEIADEIMFFCYIPVVEIGK